MPTLRKRPARRRANPIEHVFVLMLENRSFDHFLGGLPDVDGADAQRVNYDTDGSAFQQIPGANQVVSPDPKHELPHVMTQLDRPDGSDCMGGFVLDYSMSYPQSNQLQRAEVMKFFQDGKLAALHTLAKEFVICERWHASVPGPTWTNRFFAHSGTSAGIVKMPEPPFDWHLHRYGQTTVYDRLNERGVEWRIYYGDVPQSLLLAHQRRLSNLRHYRKMKHFHSDVADAPDGMPAYVFIEPSYFGSDQNDDHPPANVNRGQALIADVYNTIRANKELWLKSLIVIVYDEHGGFYDHVAPGRATPPDNLQMEYSFDRFGVRVPAVLVSPWLPRGMVDKTIYDHTSTLRFAQLRWKLGFLGARTANAQSFEHLLLQKARTNTPTSVPSGITDATVRVMATRGLEPLTVELNANQRALMAFGEHLEGSTRDEPAMKALRVDRMAGSTDAKVAVTLERYQRLLQGNLPED